ncbi:MAG: biotin--[acetyl-CoA-carboxylase] ligase [Candidatus Izimaplasma sp.]|nr:biotin--[acetyl-CoA-carboxylase] ligase [Candidatus Izimaplasma bacterium]
MIGKDILFFNSLTSTNEYVKKHLDELDAGTIVTAKQQISGKGRRGRTWISNQGNLFFSLLLEKDYESNFSYVMRASTVLVRSLAEFGLDAKIKYPNDIMVRGRKIAGILIEAKADHIIIGVGVNVKEEKFETLEKKATSIKIETGHIFDPLDILYAFVKSCNEKLDDTEEQLYQKYLIHSYVIGKEINYKGQKATITKITRKGLLQISFDDTFRLVSMDDITLEELYYD